MKVTRGIVRALYGPGGMEFLTPNTIWGPVVPDARGTYSDGETGRVVPDSSTWIHVIPEFILVYWSAEEK